MQYKHEELHLSRRGRLASTLSINTERRSEKLPMTPRLKNVGKKFPLAVED
jgi:hypothetical protein